MIRAALKILNLQENASPEDVRAAYIKLVRRYPPEHFPDKFKTIRRAYEHLLLDDSLIEETLQRFLNGGSAVELAGFLWGDIMPKDEEFHPSHLQSLLNLGSVRKKLDILLDTITEEEIQDENN